MARPQALAHDIQRLERTVARPSVDEVFDRIEARKPVQLDGRAAELIRGERVGREAS